MKLTKNKTRYDLPPHTEILQVFVPGNQKFNQTYAYAIQIVPRDRLDLNDAEPGFPCACCVSYDSIVFAPPPDKPYEVTVRYTPPIQEC